MRICLVLLALLFAVPLQAQVAESYTCVTCTVDNADTPGVGPLELTFTVDAGASLCLIAVLHLRTAVTVPVVTWNGEPMTEIGSGIHGTNAGVRMFYLGNPDTGEQTLSASWMTNSIATLGAVAFSGADCAGIGNTVTATGNSTAPSTGAVTSTATGATVGAETGAGNDISAELLTAVYRDNSQSFQNAGATYTLGDAANTHSWTIGMNTWAAMGFHIPAAAGGGGSRSLRGVGK